MPRPDVVSEAGLPSGSGRVLAALNPLEHPVCLSAPLRLSRFTAWEEHLPFAMFMIDLARPEVFVELGTHYGDSYCAFCQAVSELQLSTRCYAVDTWCGDPQTGLYGPEVLQSLRAHHDPLYGSFSRLIQTTFDEALGHFADGAIDLLHIDGYHTYDAVKQDFERWLPKLSDRGIILFHDVNVRERDFGVWKLWEELQERYPSFTFAHGHGLGVLGVGRNPPDSVQLLFRASPSEARCLSSFFFELGHRVHVAIERDTQAELALELSARVAGLEPEAQRVAQVLDARNRELEQLGRDRERVGQRLAEVAAQLADARASGDAARKDLDRITRELAAGERARDELREMLEAQSTTLAQRAAELRAIQSSLTYRIAGAYWRVEDRVLPPGTRRRRAFDRLLAPVRAVFRSR
jgi:Methyltransferase domain